MHAALQRIWDHNLILEGLPISTRPRAGKGSGGALLASTAKSPVIKRCACGCEYTAETWAQLPFGWIGHFDADSYRPEETTEFRHCTGCNSTIGIEVKKMNATIKQALQQISDAIAPLRVEVEKRAVTTNDVWLTDVSLTLAELEQAVKTALTLEVEP